MRSYVDVDGIEREFKQVTEGWLTRPWQQEIIETPGLKKVVRVSRRAGKSAMCIVKSLHMSFVQGRGVLIVAPLERQVAELYHTMHQQFIDTKPEIFNESIDQDVKNPFVIRFKNGGFINFITAGTKSGGKGDAVRGQGHGVGLIYIDEADYLTDADLDSILAIPAQDPTMEVILTSTPTGKRQRFYRLCTDPPRGWKAFHKTCYEAIPNWNEDLELEYRKQYSVDAFAREFLAEFGEEATGVFNKDTIDAAVIRGADDFPYPGMSPKYPVFGYANRLDRNDSVYRIVGVDWDKYGAGTQILIIEARKADVGSDAYSKALEQPFDYIKVVHRKEIPKSQFTLDNAVRELVQINKLFSPNFYYMDAGYGEHQIEAMIRLGMECKDPTDPAWNLHKKIVRVNFSEGVEVLDPASKRLEKRRIKPEMVNRLVNKFDAGEMVMSPFDDELKNQLINYVVVRITVSGEPKYTSENEHAVDALMLANWGLYCEYGVKTHGSLLKAFIEPPLGSRYMERKKQADGEKEKRRPNYLKKTEDPALEQENLEEDLRLASSGMIRAEEIKTAPGVPGESSRARLDQQDYFQRGGRGYKGRRTGF